MIPPVLITPPPTVIMMTFHRILTDKKCVFATLILFVMINSPECWLSASLTASVVVPILIKLTPGVTTINSNNCHF